MRLEDIEGGGNLAKDIGRPRAHSVAYDLPPPSIGLVEVVIRYPDVKGCSSVTFECVRGSGWRYVGPL